MAVLLGVGWVALSLVPFIGKVILTYIGTGSIGYVLERASASVFLDGTQPAGILVVVNAILLIISLDRIYLSRIHDSRVIHFSYILLVLCLFNLATVNQVLLSYRFSFYCYFFLPIYAVMVIDERFFGKFYFPVIYALLLIMVVRFFYKYEFGTFAYEPIAKLLFQPLIGYII